ncbi:phosphotransferase [Actinoplanes sp. NPDC049548]|uniref:phosphotransferase family protein n=1 Tax=Actinoplanes sp. NPDC049548 TaxID=3155152 RepID=UPI00343047D2
MLPFVEPIGAGLDHTAYLVNGEVVVRFSRDSSDGRAEARLLELVAGVSPVPVPRPVFVDAGCLAYRWLPGVPLLSVAPPAGVARRLGELLAALQAVPRERVMGVVEVDDTPPAEWLTEAMEVWPTVAGHVPEAHRPAVEAFLAEAAPAPATRLAFSHQDLGAEHVLVDPGSGTITGVVDWSDAAVGDPARDFGLILRDLGPEALTEALTDALPESFPSGSDEFRLRATFYARCGLLADLAYGVETGRRQYVTKSVAGLSWLFPASPLS